MTIQTNRRKFFGFMGGAAAAAPLAAKELASLAASNGPGAPIGYYGGMSATPYMPSPEHLHEELKQARGRLSSIKKPDAAARYLAQEDARHLDGLRSVSSVNKARMFREKTEERELDRETHWARKHVADLCEKLGIPFAEWLA